MTIAYHITGLAALAKEYRRRAEVLTVSARVCQLERDRRDSMTRAMCLRGLADELEHTVIDPPVDRSDRFGWSGGDLTVKREGENDG
jgi:hypothetical protein